MAFFNLQVLPLSVCLCLPSGLVYSKIITSIVTKGTKDGNLVKSVSLRLSRVTTQLYPNLGFYHDLFSLLMSRPNCIINML